MALTRPEPNPAAEQMDWMHARQPRPRARARFPPANSRARSQTSYCAIEANEETSPCKMFKPKRKSHEYL